MKKLFAIALLASAITASAQDMLINNTDGSVMDKLPMMELHKATHFTDEDGSKVKIELRNGAFYTFNTDDIVNANVTTKDEMLKKGKFADMKLVKEFRSIQELEEGDLIGIVDEKDHNYNEFYSDAYSAFSGTSTNPIVSTVDPELIKVLGSALNAAFIANLNALALKNRIPASSIRIHVTDIVYAARDIDGTIIPLSARLIYPYCSTDYTKLSVTNMYLEQHTTLLEDGTEPSAEYYPMSCSACALQGYMVLQPDLLGFGVSNMRTQLFINRDINGAHCADCIIAAKQYVDMTKEEGSQYKTVNLAPDATIISAGSSQGASTAMAFTYYMENKLSSDIAANLPKVSENHLCAGAYNPRITIDELVRRDSLNGFMIPILASTAVVARPDYMRYKDGSLIMPYDLLTPKLKAMTWTGMEDIGIPSGMDIWKIMNSKQGSSTGFAKLFRIEFPYKNNPDYASFQKMTADGMTILNEDGSYSLDYSDDRVIGLAKYLADNCLTDTALWVPNSNITMLHSINDATVPYINSELFYNNMNAAMTAKGVRINFTSYDNPGNLSHVMICLVWMMSETTGLPVSTILSLLS